MSENTNLHINNNLTQHIENTTNYVNTSNPNIIENLISNIHINENTNSIRYINSEHYEPIYCDLCNIEIYHNEHIRLRCRHDYHMRCLNINRLSWRRLQNIKCKICDNYPVQ